MVLLCLRPNVADVFLSIVLLKVIYSVTTNSTLANKFGKND